MYKEKELNNFIKLYLGKLSKVSDVKKIISDMGWTVSYDGEFSNDDIWVQSNVLEKKLIFNKNVLGIREGAKYNHYALLHEFYHLLECEMSNLVNDDSLEKADIFAAYMLRDAADMPPKKVESIMNYGGVL